MIESVTDENDSVRWLDENLRTDEWRFFWIGKLTQRARLEREDIDAIVPRLVPSSIDCCDNKEPAVLRPLGIAGDVTSYLVLEYYFVLAILDRELCPF